MVKGISVLFTKQPVTFLKFKFVTKSFIVIQYKLLIYIVIYTVTQTEIKYPLDLILVPSLFNYKNQGLVKLRIL